MILRRVPKLLTIVATAACIFGLVLVAPADTPMLSPMPTASADVLGNGYDVNCRQVNATQVVCTIGGCPRVYEDYAGNRVNTRVNQLPQQTIGKPCDSTISETVNISSGFNYAVQGCRHNNFTGSDCGAWSDYKYTPPAAPPAAPPAELPKAPVQCPPGSVTPTVPAGQQCTAAPPVQCPLGSETPTVPAGQQCKALPPKACPPGSVKPEVPASENCAAPTNTVTMNIGGGALQRTVTVTNNGPLGGTCAYDAKATGGLFAPGLNRQINVGPNASTSIDVPAPPLGSTYEVTLTCTGTYDGKQVQFGQAKQNVSSF